MDASLLIGWLAGTLLPLGAIWLWFRLGLRRERCFGYNRALLLLAPVVAVALPLLPRPDVAGWLAPAAGLGPAGPALMLPAVAAPAAPGAGSAPGAWLLGVYLLGVAAMLAGLAYRYARLRRATRHLPRERRPGYVLAYTGGRLPTSSFGRTVFWDDTATLAPAEATAVLVHVRQGHSAEVLWLELWRTLLWFNPFAHLLVPALRLTHELLADWQAMLQVASPADALAPARPYPALLARLAVQRVAGPGYLSLMQSFTFSFTLTRIAMLHNELPVRRWKQWLALPLLGGVFLATACQSSIEPVAPKAAPAPTGTAKAAEASVETLKANVIQMLQEKLAPLEQQRRAGQPLSAAQQRAYDYLQRQLKTTEEMTSSPGISTTELPSGREVAGADKVYAFVEQMPQLPGSPGMSSIVEHIQRNLVYPAGMRQEGRVFASFTVRADGSVGQATILKSLGPAYDEAVQAAIGKLPRFEPGTQGGQPVAVSFTVPITFKNTP